LKSPLAEYVNSDIENFLFPLNQYSLNRGGNRFAGDVCKKVKGTYDVSEYDFVKVTYKGNSPGAWYYSKVYVNNVYLGTHKSS